CGVYLTKSRHGATRVKSQNCPFWYNFGYSVASKLTRSPPCTNVPAECLFC
ncbi:hypothetical protein BOTBODRAFT_81198, partial [Botryobasidium botryosum FD-172 SS1]